MEKRNILMIGSLVATIIIFNTVQADFWDMFKPDSEKPYILHRWADECPNASRFKRIKWRLDKGFDEYNKDPYQKDERGRTVSEIARKRYLETGDEYCRQYAEEFEKYAQRYDQKKKEQEQLLISEEKVTQLGNIKELLSHAEISSPELEKEK
jgi:hypothetical protein